MSRFSLSNAVSVVLALLAAPVLLWQSAAALAGPVNINSADAETIARELKGIGLKRAQLIVDYRVKHGPFKSADELRLVKGLGAKVIQNNRNDIRMDAAKPVAAAKATAAVAAPTAHK